MDRQDFLTEMEHLKQLVAQWPDLSQGAVIERQIALAKLRQLYEGLLFAAPQYVQVQQTGEGNGAVKGMASEEFSAPLSASCSVSGTIAPDAESADALKACDACPDPDLACGADKHLVAANEDGVMDPAPASPCVPEGERMASESSAGQEDEPGVSTPVEQPQEGRFASLSAEMAEEQKLFSDDAMIRTRANKRVILSLYGDSPSVSNDNENLPGEERVFSAIQEQQIETTATAGDVSQESLVSEVSLYKNTVSRAEPYQQLPENDPEERVMQVEVEEEGLSQKPTSPVSHPSVKEVSVEEMAPRKRVLGEMLGAPTQAVNDLLGKKKPLSDVATKLRASTVHDLRHSIGVNDRFLLMRELFGGDAGRYESVISELDRFSTLDEALIYVQENFEWNPEGPGAMLLVELLERKLE